MKTSEENETWSRCITAIKKHYTIQQLKTWIDPINLKVISKEEKITTIVLTAPNKYKQQWATTQLKPKITAWFSTHLKENIAVKIESTQQLAKKKPSSPVENDSEINNNLLASKPHQKVKNSHLNSDWTFDTFVLGKANQLARAAAQQICDNPGLGYNPFFLYGGVGLGKTHLIHAIGNHILNDRSSASVKYIHAESYVSDVVRAYQSKSFEEFKKSYHSLDILLIDDIQFFSGKSRTQEEFFYAFEALIAAKKQIIITCDT